MSYKTINYETYRKKVEGCWLGKSVGGTLGGPNEGNEGPLSLTFYDPVPTEMLPNDDLDLQVVWHEKIRTAGLPVNRRDLSNAWLESIHLFPDEYGVAARNLTKKIYPPLSGSWDNKFSAGMGAAIRTELWACIAPGDPDLAVNLAREDACVDHADEGIYAPVFLAAIESLAFVESNPLNLIERALGYISQDSRLYKGVNDTRHWYKEGNDWLTIRSLIKENHGRQNWTDVVPNLCFIVLGLLMFEKEGFDKSLCTAVNCGLDTDCTGATLASIFGIINPDCIDKKWLEPIGKKMVLSPGMAGMRYPLDLDKFSNEVAETAVNVLDYYQSEVELTDNPWNKYSLKRQIPYDNLIRLNFDPGKHALLSINPLIIKINYGSSPVFLPSESREITLELINPTDKKITGEMDLSLPRGWETGLTKTDLSLEAKGRRNVILKIEAPPESSLRTYINYLNINLTLNGISLQLTAGMSQSYPWILRRANCIEKVENSAHYFTAPQGELVYETDIKIPWKGFFMFITQGLDRKIKTYLDGELINDYDGSFYVPAVHRNMTGTGKEVQRGWHRICLEVAEGPESEIFFDVGIANNWSLLNDMEWRLINE